MENREKYYTPHINKRFCLPYYYTTKTPHSQTKNTLDFERFVLL